MFLRHLSLGLVLALLALPATAAEEGKGSPKMIGTFNGWKAYSYDDKGQPVCYMTLASHFAPNKKLKRTLAYLTITHRPSENSKDVVSYTSGYSFKTTSDVKIQAGKKDFDLFTQSGTAWSRDAATDHAIASAIRDAASIKVTGDSTIKGLAPVTDTIDVKGASAAYRAITKACGYPVPAETKKEPATAKKPAAKKTAVKPKH